MYTVQIFKGELTRKLVHSYPDKVFLFGDNVADKFSGYVPTMTQAQIRGLDNAVGIPTKHNRYTNDSSYFNDDQFDEFKYEVDCALILAICKAHCGSIVIPAGGIGTGKAQLKQRAPKCYAYLQSQLKWLYNNSNH